MPHYVRDDLAPTTIKAQKITRLIRDNINMSYRSISQNFENWDTYEEEYRAYRPLDDEDRESIKKNKVQKIVVPIQFATLQTMLTFMMEVFTSLKPILRVRGSDPATQKRARVVEVTLDYDYRGNRGFFTLYQWFLNAYRYGYAPIENSWGIRSVLKRVLKSGPPGRLLLEGQEFIVPGPLNYVNDYTTVFEGNKWRIVDPRKWFFDPRVAVSRFQEGQFCGKQDRIHDNELRELEDDGLFFNTNYVKGGGPVGASVREADITGGDDRRSRFSGSYFQEAITQARRDKMHVNEEIVIRIIPEEYDLSNEDRPEAWIFNLIDGKTLVRAEPSPFMRFPYEIVEAYPDELAFMSQGLMELTSPLAAHLNFLFNSHMANVRKAINDSLLVDPSRIDIADILDPRAGKIIRLLPLAYGTDPAAAVKQLNVVDVTKGHTEDARLIMDLWQRITGSSDAMFGQVVASRRTAFELQGVFKMSASRMKTQADLFSAEGVAPLTEQMVTLRQENMSMEQFMEIGGQTAIDLGVHPNDIVDNFIRVRREHMSGVFSYPAEEGVLPQDRAQAAQLLKDAFETVSRSPFLPMVMDPIGIFREMMRQGGYHNIDEFMKSAIRPDVQLMGPEEIAALLAKGRLAPLEQGRPDEGVRTDAEGLTLNGALRGAGRTRDQRTTTA